MSFLLSWLTNPYPNQQKRFVCQTELEDGEIGNKEDQQERMEDEFKDDVLEEAKKSWELRKMLTLFFSNEINVI